VKQVAKEVKVTLMPMGAEVKEVSMPVGSTIRDSLIKGGINPGSAEARIDNKAVKMDAIIRQNEQVVILSDGEIQGN